jgi:WD40 repeat protein
MGDDADHSVRIWDVDRGEQVHALDGHTDGGYALAFNSTGTLLASGAMDGAVCLWDTASWKLVKKLPNRAKVYGVAFTPDGNRLASACSDNLIRFWDLATYQEVAQLHGHEAYVHQVAFSPDGSRLASASGDGIVRIWDSVSRQDRAAKGR